MIVRNEQSFLDDCLLSLRGLVDEIVIVDTGSTDASIDVAQRHGARIIEWTWRDDFAAARNVGLEAASGDWILYIDADERLVDTSHEALRAGLDDPRVFVARLKFRVRSDSTLYREFRLLRNDPRLRFAGAIHETIRPDLQRLRASIGARTIHSPAMLVHLGYDGDMTAKYQRNLPLLLASVERDPDRIYYWNDLAQTLDGLGRIDEALEVSARGLARPVPDDAMGKAMRSMLVHTGAWLRLNNGDDVRQLIAEGLELYPDNWSLRFLRARDAINRGDNAAAVDDLSQLVAQDWQTLCDEHLAYDRRIFGCYAHDLMGVALLRLGDRAGASAAFARAADAAPDVQAYRIKALALGGRPVSAAGSATAPASAA